MKRLVGRAVRAPRHPTIHVLQGGDSLSHGPRASVFGHFDLYLLYSQEIAFSASQSKATSKRIRCQRIPVTWASSAVI